MDYYILKGKIPIKVDLMEWAEWMQQQSHGEIKVAYDKINNIEVSTIFLGIPRGWGDKIELFETMIFGGPANLNLKRYATYTQALRGHNEILKQITLSIRN